MSRSTAATRMLATLVAALALANLGFRAWTAGWLDPLLGTPARSGRDTGRLAQQLRPETVRVLQPAEAAAAMSAPPIEADVDAAALLR